MIAVLSLSPQRWNGSITVYKGINYGNEKPDYNSPALLSQRFYKDYLIINE